jgi:predicted alpha/beta hydrolase family esterase
LNILVAPRSQWHILFTMTATQVIAEIENLPREERERVFVRVHELEDEMIPQSFLQGMAEALRGDLIDVEDAHFSQPPA